MYPKPIKNFVDRFSKLPSVGPRQAARLAFWLLNQPKTYRSELKKALEDLEKETKTCPQCFFVIDGSASFDKVHGSTSLTINKEDKSLTIKNDGNKCGFCDNPSRDQKTICVVEKETDLATIEKSGVYNGLYHVLGGLFSALDTAVPKNLRLPELIVRIQEHKKNKTAEEVILALSPTHEGDLTVHYLERALKPLKIKITRLGRGLPYGADVEFADAETLSGALEGRKEIK
ncbi:hypothetical protein A2833_01310 [Candidatus Azambacteria bacterium RIFCSPHIGHO2_01_FULL_44_55]|uniref:Recombination protein RecR n=1 Tax=Candidatus Azambacteria bacterium RIFCSPLOWO2_02_FULL_44_14 TaxID=1797306 RepID=A0A1F5C9R7_9BACT|nr:MAG: hypothetical protein A3A18_01880 [Candidatus Azambacteria bacterium RIFCSPLOWO2_01_FULL_44_84]OGD33148.1 MAG: hypothetical protein A3C78_02710 [Candidatus Azambacteria bacterium RIFCSPHIGHO2_02_FULL_45_18]OGD39607.1 MAG: hypothetical protein A3I30_03850 [Candidatus Azambacteria bacterium RIFCSPLOWO2_02_FULL_44_14]OGD39932.1 MAG: hypothetical protein A2833_01310 [Candidatus Azambacteria bacterium RIFCSPHIGHO2_01_FULL_44_55]